MDLNSVLAELYESPQDARRLADRIGLRTAHIAFESSTPLQFWYSMIGQAKLQGKLGALVFAAYQEYPEHRQLNYHMEEILKAEIQPLPQSVPVAELERRMRELEISIARIPTIPPGGSLTPRTMTEALVFALIIIVLIFALRG